MARSVTEWRGKNDDVPPPASCKRRILDRQGHVCALTGLPFDDKHKPKFDHITPLWLGGENREANLQAIRDEPHKVKTAAEAAVRSKVNANIDKRFGLKKPKQKIPSRGFDRAPPKQPKQALPPKPIYGLWTAGESTGD